MPKDKQYVFSARTTKAGLKELNRLKAELGISWDRLVVDAVCAHYGLDSGVLTLPASNRPRLTDKERKAHRRESSTRHNAKKVMKKVAKKATRKQNDKRQGKTRQGDQSAQATQSGEAGADTVPDRAVS